MPTVVWDRSERAQTVTCPRADARRPRVAGPRLAATAEVCRPEDNRREVRPTAERRGRRLALYA
jgi:hypothetical protein